MATHRYIISSHNVLPYASASDCLNMHCGNAEILRDGSVNLSRFPALTYLSDISFSQLGHGMALTPRPSALANGIRRILFGATKKQVRGVAASRDIAMVADKLSRPLAMSNKPNSSGGANSPTHLARLADTPTSIMCNIIPSPEPAIIWPALFNVLPNSLLKRLGSPSIRTCSRAVDIGIPSRAFEHLFAVLTRIGGHRENPFALQYCSVHYSMNGA